MNYEGIVDLIENSNQQYHSDSTSNSKLPVIYKKLKELKVEITDAIDYGCGRYFDKYKPDNVKGFDKYSYKEYENLNHHYAQGICSNVLNVIKEKEERINVLKVLHSICDTVYVTIYEGDKSEVGCITMSGCWQENRLFNTYRKEIEEVFDSVTSKYKVYICK